MLTPQAKLIHVTPQALIAYAGRASYQSWDDQKLTDDQLIAHFAKHKESPLESAWAMVSVELSFAAHVHFLRHRHMSFSFLSERYTEALPAYVPPGILERGGKAAHAAAKVRIMTAYDTYNALRAKGDDGKAVLKQDARYVMPQAAGVQGFISGNARGWLNLLELRTSSKAMPEVRLVARLILEELRPHWPIVLGGLK